MTPWEILSWVCWFFMITYSAWIVYKTMMMTLLKAFVYLAVKVSGTRVTLTGDKISFQFEHIKSSNKYKLGVMGALMYKEMHSLKGSRIDPKFIDSILYKEEDK